MVISEKGSECEICGKYEKAVGSHEGSKADNYTKPAVGYSSLWTQLEQGSIIWCTS